MPGVNADVASGSFRANANGFSTSKSYNSSNGILTISGVSQKISNVNGSSTLGNAGTQNGVTFAYLVTGTVKAL